jgi:hypothetical protein
MISAANIAALEKANIDYILGVHERSTMKITEFLDPATTRLAILDYLMTIFCLTTSNPNKLASSKQRQHHCHASLHTVSNSACPPRKLSLALYSTTYDPRAQLCSLSPPCTGSVRWHRPRDSIPTEPRVCGPSGKGREGGSVQPVFRPPAPLPVALVGSVADRCGA